ncbi:MAG: nitroreductase [Paenibacillaceae bacterium]|jgi:nitroreductase|nr:nitroreductase [Paenibacillaceae bacterium]
MSQAYESISTTIRERRSIRQFLSDPIPHEVVLELLDTAAWAPFHSVKEPWRFIMFTGEGRKQFSDAVLSTYTQERKQQFGEQVAQAYCHQVPVHLIVCMEEDPRPKQWEEALSAVSALIQNLQLLAWERKIGVVWKTNDYNWDPRFRESVGIKPGQKVVGTLHMGYFDPSIDRMAKPRTPAAELLTLIDH